MKQGDTWDKFYIFNSLFLLLIIFSIQGCNGNNLIDLSAISTSNNKHPEPDEILLILHTNICASKFSSKEKLINLLLAEEFIQNQEDFNTFNKKYLNINTTIELVDDNGCITNVRFKNNIDSGLQLYFDYINIALIDKYRYKSQGQERKFDNKEEGIKTIRQDYISPEKTLIFLDISINAQDQYSLKLSSKIPAYHANLTSIKKKEIDLIMWISVGFALFLFFKFTLFLYKYFTVTENSLVQKISKSHEGLLGLMPEQLKEAEKYLSQANLLDKTLEKSGVNPDVFTTAIHVLTILSAQKKAIWISKRINARSDFSTNFSIMRYQDLRLDDSFLLNIKKIRLYLPDKFTTPRDAIKKAKTFPKANRRITLIIGRGSEYQLSLYYITKLLENKLVAPQGNEITRLLLSPNPERILAEILSNQLSLHQISPYNVNGGVSNQSVFFGRIEMINQIINRDPANYLVIGGRQMGKSSLLKALERHYADISSVTCYYQSLSSEVLIPRLATMLNLPASKNPEDFAHELEAYLQTIDTNLVFLIDEADRFVEHETGNDYQVLNILRRLSEEGRCTFILAGFWQLYQHAVLDYQSPIRNFAEILSIGALEKEACYQLATEPMKSMNLCYANDAIIEILVESCGQRANLIAIACQHIVVTIHPEQHAIEAADVQKALHSEGIRNALAGWVLGETPEEEHYDKLVVYATIAEKDFSIGELIQLLQSKGMDVNIGELDRTLARLELAYILGKDQSSGRYFYRVPLFVDMILRDDPLTRLKAELK